MKPRYIYRFSRFDIGFGIDILLWWIFDNGNDNDTSKSFYFQKENKKTMRQTTNTEQTTIEISKKMRKMRYCFGNFMVLTYISMLCFLGQAVNAVKTMHFHSWDEQKKKKLRILWRSLLCFWCWCCCSYYYYCMHPTVVGITRERACIE